VSAENHRNARIEVADVDGYHRPALLDFFMSRYMSAYAAEIACFVDCVATGKSPPTTGRDGYLALVLAEAAVRSVQEKRVINLAELLN